VKDAAGWDLFAKSRRHGQVNLRWHDIAQLVDGESCVVRDNGLRQTSLIAAPQRPADQILSLSRGIVAQAIKTTVDLEPVAPPDVKVLLAVGIPGLKRLACREVPSLGRGNLIKPSGILQWVSFHLQNPYIYYKDFTPI
jgi:hypothetical protein